MRNIREILRSKWSAGVSSRQIARSFNCSHTTILNILNRAEQSGLHWPLPEDLDDTALEAIIYPALNKHTEGHPEPDMNYFHRELRRKNVTLQLLWSEYKEQHSDSVMYSQFCKQYKKWCSHLEVSMRQTHRAGEKMFVDWAGQTFPITNSQTGEVQDSYLFIAILGASDYTYAEASMTMALPQWIMAHCHAFSFFRGVPEIVVPDNLLTGVSHPDRYEPGIATTYQEMANHYGTVIIPARVRKPKDKAKVENAVQIAERWILAALRNQIFFSITEFNLAIARKLSEMNNKPFQKMEGTRRILFETIDRPALKPLPEQPYELAIWKKARVNIDYHVEYETNYYSVPYQLVHEEVELRITVNTIEILYKGKRVASHLRSYEQRYFSTELTHCPVSHQKYLEWTPSRLIHWAETVGPHTGKLIEETLIRKVHPEQAYRSCMGIMRLSKSYPSERMEAGAKRALTCHAISYKSLKSILEKGLDQLELPQPLPVGTIQHENIRGSAYYNDEGGSHLC
jgi:transposase